MKLSVKSTIISAALIILILAATNARLLSQVIAGEDQTICIGMSTQLSASNGSNYSWTAVPPDPSLTNPNSPNPTITPQQTTMYIVESREVDITLIENGDFENGNQSFYSNYLYNPASVWNYGTYAVTTNANSVHSNFFCNQDHTSGFGNMMVVNGHSIPGEVVWGQTINSIAPFTDYEFSVWVSSMVASNPAILQFRINGNLIDLPFQVSPVECEWNQFFKIWNSGPATVADISIVNQNTNPSGNDFALDDISYAKVTFYQDTTWVFVEPVPNAEFSSPATSCLSDTINISYTGNAPATANYHWDFNGATVISGSGPGPYQLIYNLPGIKNVSLFVDGYGCSSDTNIQSLEIMQLPEILLTADAMSIPYGTSTTLHADISTTPGPFAHYWEPAALLIDPDQLDTETELLYQTTKFTSYAQDDISSCYDSADIIISVTGGPLGIVDLTASPDSLCPGEKSMLEALVSGGSGNYELAWTSSPPGFSYSGPEQLIEVMPASDTWYFVEVDDGFTSYGPDSIFVAVNAPPAILEHPVNLMLNEGEDAVFTCEGDFASSYQWQESTDQGASWSDLADNLVYSGTQSSILTVHNISPGMNAYLYRCMISGICDPALTSDSALLQVVENNTVTTRLSGNEFCEDDIITIPVTVENFTGVTAFTLSLNFDALVLNYTDIDQIHAELESRIDINVNAGKIEVDWADTVTHDLDTAIIFQINFSALDTGYTDLNWNISESQYLNILSEPMSSLFLDTSLMILPLPEEADELAATPATVFKDENKTIELNAYGGSGDTFQWYEGNCNTGTYIGSGTSIEVPQPSETTNYFGAWFNQCGVSACRPVTVTVKDRLVLQPPTAFSPNGDNLNDVFRFESINKFDVFNLQVFDRWGTMIFESDHVNLGWDGKISGKAAPTGSYAWKLQYMIEGEPEEQTMSGFVTLIR